MRTFRQILENAGYEVATYSGRGMGGEECLSVRLGPGLQGPPSNLGRFFADVLEEIRPITGEDEDVAKAFRKMRTDDLGRDVVVYFPGIKFEE